MNQDKSLSGALHWLPNSNKRILPPQEAQTVLNLLENLDFFAGKESGILDRVAAARKPVDINVLRKETRDYWYANLNLIDLFIRSEKGKSLTDEQKQILLGWKHRNHGKFLCVKYYAQYAVFRSMNTNDDNYYAVLGLTDDFDQLLPHDTPPYMLETALLPYKDAIIWDGLVATYGINLNFGKEITSIFNEECQKLKKENRIIAKMEL